MTRRTTRATSTRGRAARPTSTARATREALKAILYIHGGASLGRCAPSSQRTGREKETLNTATNQIFSLTSRSKIIQITLPNQCQIIPIGRSGYGDPKWSVLGPIWGSLYFRNLLPLLRKTFVFETWLSRNGKRVHESVARSANAKE